MTDLSTVDLSERQWAGRQPGILHMNPSRDYPWYGTYLGNREMSEQQFNGLITANMPLVNPPTLTVRRNATDKEMWWGTNQFPPYFQFECPVIKSLADGRYKVISPSGAVKIVLKDGWVTRPGKRKSPSIW